jgi:hypothetical protein
MVGWRREGAEGFKVFEWWAGGFHAEAQRRRGAETQR